MSKSKVYGLEQARAQLPLIAAEAEAGYSSEITRHGKPVAMVVPVKQWQAQQGRAVKVDGVLALRGTGVGLWPRGAASAVVDDARSVAPTLFYPMDGSEGEESDGP